MQACVDAFANFHYTISAVPSGLSSLRCPYPTLKRWAIVIGVPPGQQLISFGERFVRMRACVDASGIENVIVKLVGKPCKIKD